MGFWLLFFFWLATSIVTALLTKPGIEDARASGLDDFQVPTATEGRIIPLIVGKVKMGGLNVVWYGDLVAEAVREKVGGFFGIGAKKVTLAYRYHLGVQLAVCRGPIDGYDRIWFGSKLMTSGETTGDFVVSDEEFFGGEKKGGGIGFTLAFQNGAINQTPDPYLSSKYSPTPGYVNTAQFILSDGTGGPGYIGNQASLRTMAFELFWFPNSLGVTGGKERIGEDGNPICFLYELLVTNTDWGLNMQASDVLLTGTAEEGNLIAVAEQVADEGLGFSMVIDREMQAREIISEIERHVDGVFLMDLTDGKFKIKLARPPIAAVPLLDESNVVELLNYARGNWASTKNEIRVGYADRAKDYDSTFSLDQDLANREIVNQRNVAQLNFPGCKTAAVAGQLAARELRTLSFPLAKVSLRVTRDQYALQRGSPFNWTWPDESITALPMRVIKIRYGTDADGEITVDAVEDIYQLELNGFVDPPASSWTPPNFDAADPLDARIWEPPEQIAATQGQGLVLLLARDGGLHLDYDLYVDFDGGIGDMVLTNEASSDWTPIAELAGALGADIGDVNPYVGDVIIDNLSDLNIGILTGAANSTINSDSPQNILLVDDEVMWFEGATDNGGGSVTLNTVHRGALGTIPADHLDNARVWFPGLGAATLLSDTTEQDFIRGDTIRVKVVTRTGNSATTVAAASPIPLATDYTVETALPYSARDVLINGVRAVDDDWSVTVGTLALTWKATDQDTAALALLQDDLHELPRAGVGYNIRIFRRDTDVQVGGFNGIPVGSAGGAFTAFDFVPTDANGAPITDQFGIEIESRIGAIIGQMWSKDFTIKGFGFDFGGTDAESPNLIGYGGSLIAGDGAERGAPPPIVEPFPGLDTGRFSSLTLGGALNTKMDLYVQVSLYNTILQSIQQEFYTIAGTGKGNLSDYISELADLIRTDYTTDDLIIQQAGPTLTLTTFFGSITLSVTNNAGSGYTQLLESSAAPNNGRFGEYWFDFYEQNNQGQDDLAPAISANYLSPDAGTNRANLVINPVGGTLQKRRELDELAISGVIPWRSPVLDATLLPLGATDELPPVSYSKPLENRVNNNTIDVLSLETAIQERIDNSDWGKVLLGVRFGTITFGATIPGGSKIPTRPALIITTKIGIGLSGFGIGWGGIVNGDNTPASNPYSLLMQTGLAALAEIPNGLPQTSTLQFSGPYNSALRQFATLETGITLSIIFEGASGGDYTDSYTTTATDQGEGPRFDRAILTMLDTLHPVAAMEDPLNPNATRIASPTNGYRVTRINYFARPEGEADGPMTGPNISLSGLDFAPARLGIATVEIERTTNNIAFGFTVDVNFGMTIQQINNQQLSTV